ncbi:MAG: MBL fold metallo-hydrolase [Candidatus Promineifilaceae bacterium]|nr:MBL fold metallo-hydrolase [Candidatus Promineifilaceae bacterium]
MDTLLKPVSKTVTAGGRCIYSFPVRAFPELVANIYLVSDGQTRWLVDTGSGRAESNADLVAGLAAVGETFGEPITLAELDGILITHGHIDHFGGLPFVRQHSSAPIGVHPLDRRVLSHYEERVLVAARQLETFLKRAGVGRSQSANLMAMYLFAKNIYHSTAVQFTLEEGRYGPADILVHHVPGHCPGQVCLQVDDILLTADHVLSRTSPHQAPESITNNTGLGHYLASLAKIRRVEGVSLALGGHEAPIVQLQSRIGAIEALHAQRLEQVLEICAEPRSTAAISRALFGRAHGYHVLLALEEAGAHVEYLYQLGELVAANLDEIESEAEPVVRYRRV